MAELDERKWKTSSRSGGNGSCVEVNLDDVVRVRDTKQNGRGPILAFDPGSWQTFTHWLNGDAPGR